VKCKETSKTGPNQKKTASPAQSLKRIQGHTEAMNRGVRQRGMDQKNTGAAGERVLRGKGVGWVASAPNTSVMIWGAGGDLPRKLGTNSGQKSWKNDREWTSEDKRSEPSAAP